MNIAIDPNILIAAQTLASKDSSRAILNGICIEVRNGKCFVVATDGKKLGVFNNGSAGKCNNGDESLTFRVEAAMLKSLKPYDKVLVVHEPHALTVEIRNVVYRKSITLPVIEGAFPSWRQVVPLANTKLVGAADSVFDWMILKPFGDVAKIINACSCSVRVLRQENDSAGIEGHVVLLSSPYFLGIIMPMRTYGTPAVPEWIDEPKPKPAPLPQEPPKAAEQPQAAPAAATTAQPQA